MLTTIFQIINPVIGATGSGEGGEILGRIISASVGLILIVGTIGALIFFIIGALRWIVAGGDKTRLQNAQDEITHSIVGLVILAAAWAIFILLSQFTGIGVFTPEGGSIDIPTVNDASGGTGTPPRSCQQNGGTCHIGSCSDLSSGTTRYTGGSGVCLQGNCCVAVSAQ